MSHLVVWLLDYPTWRQRSCRSPRECPVRLRMRNCGLRGSEKRTTWAQRPAAVPVSPGNRKCAFYPWICLLAFGFEHLSTYTFHIISYIHMCVYNYLHINIHVTDLSILIHKYTYAHTHMRESMHIEVEPVYIITWMTNLHNSWDNGTNHRQPRRRIVAAVWEGG